MILAHTVVNKPICPVMIEDPFAGMCVCLVLLSAGVYTLWKVMAYYSRP
jgi:hypothetical protein